MVLAVLAVLAHFSGLMMMKQKYRCKYLHRSRDSVSPLCGIFSSSFSFDNTHIPIRIRKYQSEKLYLYSYSPIFGKLLYIYICLKNGIRIYSYLYWPKKVNQNKFVLVCAKKMSTKYICIHIRASKSHLSHTGQGH